MNITVISAYTWFNKGDAAILLGTVNEINEFFKAKGVQDLSFNILTFTPKIDRSMYTQLAPNIKSVESNLLNPYPVKKTKVHKSIAILKLAFRYMYLKLMVVVNFNRLISKSKSLILCDKSDIIIVCGGGFLGGNKYNSLIHLAQINIVKKLNKKMILWGTSIEPPRKKLLKKITEKQLSTLDCILPREEVTSSYINKWFPTNQIKNTPDLAFKTPYLKTSKIEKKFFEVKEKALEKKIIGVTMREWNFPKSKDPKERKENYEKALVNLINYKNKDTLFVFIPQVIMEGDDDRIFAKRIQNMLIDSNSLFIIEDDFSPYELKWIISKFDQFLGTRMHSNIFSSSMFLPPVAIAYEKKTNGIMDKLGLGDYVVDIENVTAEVLMDLLEKNSKNKMVLQKNLINKMNSINKEIRIATEFVLSEEI
ncbi:MAG: polysaccharide pyruvyl transferase family protein [Enterococcus hulanensis]